MKLEASSFVFHCTIFLLQEEGSSSEMEEGEDQEEDEDRKVFELTFR